MRNFSGKFRGEDESGRRAVSPSLDHFAGRDAVIRGIDFDCLIVGRIDGQELSRWRSGRIERPHPAFCGPTRRAQIQVRDGFKVHQNHAT
jgi:hypothetical protein